MIKKVGGCGNMCTQKKSLDNWDCRKFQPTYGDGKTKGQIRQTTDLYYVCEPTQWIHRGVISKVKVVEIDVNTK